MTGKMLRLRRLAHDGRFVLVPMDHGVSDGPVQGLRRAADAIRRVAQGGATSVVLHKGLVKQYGLAGVRLGLWLHVSASTAHAPDPNDKRLVGRVDEAVALGADGISVHVNVGSATEADQLAAVGDLTGDAAAFGMPVLAMMYPRGHDVKDPYEPGLVAHAARLGEELGADVVKTLYTGDPDSFRDVVAGLGVPVLVAGGPRTESPGDVLEMVHGALQAGAAGVSIGRNVFQHEDPAAMTAALRSLVVDDADVATAKKRLEGGGA